MSHTSRLRAIARDVLRRAWSHAGLLCVLGVAVVDRILFLRWWKAFPGGDTYNFIVSAQELLQASYPIAEKRLPFYPLLIAIAHGVLDWETAAIAVAVVASLVSIVLLYALGRTFSLSKTALVVALLPFQAIAPFLFQSVRGYADTTFVALTLGALVVFLRLRTRRGAGGLGALLGAACLTRPEGLAFALPVLILLALGPRRRLVLPALAIVLLFLGGFAVFSLHVGRPIAPREYLLDAAVSEFGVSTVRAFAANYGALWQAVGVDRLWGEPRRLLRDATATNMSDYPQRLWSFLTDPKEAPSLLLLAGLIFLLRKRRLAFLAILLPFLALAIPIAWWGVRQRFLITLYPLPFFLLAAGTHALLDSLSIIATRGPQWWPAGSVPSLGRAWGDRAGMVPRPQLPQVRAGESEGIPGSEPASLGGTTDRTTGWAEPKAGLARTTVAATLLTLSIGFWSRHTASEAREVQTKNWGRDFAYYQAITAARTLPGVIAFAHRSSIALALFGEIDNRGRAVFADVHLNTPQSAEQWEGLRTRGVQYIVTHGTPRAAFPVLSDPAFRDHFRVVRTFTRPESRGRVDTAEIVAVYE